MKRTATVLLILLLQLAAWGQGAGLKPVEPPELVARRADHLRAMQRVKIAPLTAYLQALAGLRQQFAREAKAEAVAAIDEEIKSARDELSAANATVNITTAAPVQLQIELVEYGHPETKRIRDVTEVVRNAFTSGNETIVLGGKELGVGDVAPGQHKIATITYTINGMRKKKTVPSDTLLNFKHDLR